MVSQYALRAILGQEESHNELQNEWVNQNEDLSVNFCGKYSLVVTNEILLGMRNGNSIYVKNGIAIAKVFEKMTRNIACINYSSCLFKAKWT